MAQMSPQALCSHTLSKGNHCISPLFYSLLLRAFTLLWTRSWNTEICVFWSLNAKHCLASGSSALSVISSKFSSCTEFNVFDLEKSSLPSEMNLLAESLWAESTLLHTKTQIRFSVSLIDYGNYGCQVTFALKSNFRNVSKLLLYTNSWPSIEEKQWIIPSCWILLGCLHLFLIFLPFSFARRKQRHRRRWPCCLPSPNILLAGHSAEDIQVPSVI